MKGSYVCVLAAAALSTCLLTACSAGAPSGMSHAEGPASAAEPEFDVQAFQAQQREQHDRAYAEMSRGEVGSCWGYRTDALPVAGDEISYRVDCEQPHRIDVAGVVSYQPHRRVEKSSDSEGAYEDAEVDAIYARCQDLLGGHNPHNVNGNHVAQVGVLMPVESEWNAAVDTGEALDIRCTWYNSPMQSGSVAT